MPTLQKESPLPLYHQLKEELRKQILAGHLAPHTAIPSEPELVASYHVSRATVRQALDGLVHEGLLYREHGRGTFVSEPRIQQPLSELVSLTEELKRRGKRPGGLLIVSELVRGSAVVRDRLKLADEEQVLRLERVRTADGQPYAHEVAYLPYPRSSGVYQRVKEAASGSLYALMASEGLGPYVAGQSLKGSTASEREAELLRVTPGEPGLRASCTTYNSTGQPVEYSESFFPSDRFGFAVTLRVAHS
jgi:DNA-binding GntR family transcriptional regulator